jgi:hypothetical protein
MNNNNMMLSDKTIKYAPAKSLKYNVGDLVKLNGLEKILYNYQILFLLKWRVNICNNVKIPLLLVCIRLY